MFFVLTFFFPDNLFIFGCAGSSFLTGFSLVAARRGYSQDAVCRLITEVASLVAEHRL